ncbi:MAG: GAP family protein [Solirubrobacterales bacterium]|nr:GAP family protein [Solirubrobacterales bacterium]
MSSELVPSVGSALLGQAVGQSLSLAVAAAVSPFPIIGMVLILTSKRATANGSAFLVGWLAGCGAVGTIVLILSSDEERAPDGGRRYRDRANRNRGTRPGDRVPDLRDGRICGRRDPVHAASSAR